MNQPILLFIKFITCLIAFGIGLDLFFDANFVDILSFSLFVTFASYVVGELVILPQLGRRAAAVADFLLSYLSVWIFGSILFENYLQIAWGSIISAIIITGAEIVIHLMVQNRDEHTTYKSKRNSILNSNLAYGTEISEEEYIKDVNKIKK
ncbi:YndM family protein [Metabacillus halosaccharovorans]|uniref:YndM family protein n=1 Tax=Metabacillus halosaccharovorans TaxID=930124 RepID=UPI002041AE17|nr:YndM family protein [Metabacillus halosaccharovorans]MCM3441569.1 YndM family protein [Metabacillus halosaccharovorans]